MWVEAVSELFRALRYIYLTHYLTCRHQCVDPFSLVYKCAFSLQILVSSSGILDLIKNVVVFGLRQILKTVSQLSHLLSHLNS